MKPSGRYTWVSIWILVLAVSCGNVLHAGESSESNLWYVVVTDVHTSNDEEKMTRMSELVSRMNTGIYSHVDFLVITGDCVSSFLLSRDEDHFDPANNRSLKLMSVLEELEKPFYLIMGNHEYKIDKQKDSDAPFSQVEIDTIEVMWKRFTGFEPYYSFMVKDMQFLALNTMRGRPNRQHFDNLQIEWLKEELSDGEPSILFMHHPARTDHLRIWCFRKDLITKQSDPAFFALCENHSDQIRGVFVGHGHRWVTDKLYGTIPLFEAESFGDNTQITGYLVGVNKEKKQIVSVERIVE